MLILATGALPLAVALFVALPESVAIRRLVGVARAVAAEVPVVARAVLAVAHGIVPITVAAVLEPAAIAFRLSPRERRILIRGARCRRAVRRNTRHHARMGAHAVV